MEAATEKKFEVAPAQRRASRNALVTVISVALIDGAYFLTMPLLPDYLVRLNLPPGREVAAWTGLLMGVTPAIAAIAGPWWGRVGDRVGLWLMSLRATFMLGLVWLGIGLARNVYDLLAWRVVLGLFGGYQTMVMALATQGVRARDVGRTVARVQIVQIATAALAPALGGWLAGHTGIRPLFFASSGFCLAALLLFVFLYRDLPSSQGVRHTGGDGGAFLSRLGVLGFAAFLLFLQSMIDRSFPPAGALWASGHAASPSESAHLAGLILSLGALGDGLAAWYCGRCIAAGASGRRLLIRRAILGALVCLLLAAVDTIPSFLVARLLVSLLGGGGLTILYASYSRDISERTRSSDLSVLSSSALLGHGAGALAAGMLATRDIRYVFVANAALFLVLAWLIRGARLGLHREKER